MKTTLLVSLLLALTASANAHFLWMTMDAKGESVTMELADSPGKDVAPILYQIKDRITLHGLDRLTDSSNHAQMTASVTAKNKAVGVEAMYGIFGSSLIHWSAKAANGLGQTTKPIGLGAEIILRKIGHSWKAIVTKDGKPVAGAEVEVYLSRVEQKGGKSGPDGSIDLPDPKGILSIGAFIHEPGKGLYKGQNYAEKLEGCSLVVRV